jgi:hypothetical protein
MSLKESLVFALLAGGIVAMIAGFALVSRGVPLGWASVVLALPMLFIAQRSMRLGNAMATPSQPTDDPRAPLGD